MRRNEARAEGGVLRRVAAAGVAVLTAATMAVSSPLTALAAEAQGGNSPAVTVNKVATPLDENDQTDVTLSIGSTESKENVAVMFVLDYSTSIEVRDAAADMLDELASKTNTNVKACVINYNAEADEGKWVTVDANTDTNALLHTDRESGTNYHAGLLSAEQALQSSEISGYETYLVTISDGLTYLWTGDDGVTESVYFQQGSNGEYSIQNGNSVIEMKYPGPTRGTSSKIPDDVFNALVNGSEDIAAKYEATKEYFIPFADKFDSKTDPYISFQPGWVDAQGRTPDDFLIGSEIALYKTAAEWQTLLGMVDNAYAYKLDENHWGQYPYGEQLMDWMADQAKGGEITEETAAETFKGISDQILYEIASGTVTDVIGDDFNLTGLDTLKMTVGDKTLEGTVSGNTVTFDNGNYVVSYDEAAKTLTWKINVPVEAANGITLSYNLTLANKEALAGDYTVPTNESAKLDYTRHDGSTGTATFPVPEVSYSIAAETTGGFTAQKELEGAELTDGEFSFQVKDADGNVIDEATNDADGKIAFGKNMTYSAPGTYEYTISEVLPEDDDPDTAGVQKDDVTYDETVQKVTVDVKLVGNELVATWNLPKDGVKFTNVYTAEEAPVEEPAAEEPKAEEPAAEESKKDEAVPNTGDPTSLMTVGAALVAGVGAAAAGIAVRRRNK